MQVSCHPKQKCDFIAFFLVYTKAVNSVAQLNYARKLYLMYWSQNAFKVTFVNFVVSSDIPVIILYFT